MILEISLLILGLIALWVGSDLIIDGAKNISQHFKISPLFIGLTIASIGTSIPEMTVSIAGGLKRLQGLDISSLVLGNAIGSAFNQISLFLGIIGLLAILKMNNREWKREGLMLIVSTVLLLVVCFDLKVTIWEGYILIITYIVYFINLFKEERLFFKLRGPRPEMHPLFDLIMIIIGLATITYGGHLTINYSIALSQLLGIKETLIGIFIIGVGTGLPELALSLRAITKNELDLSVGNLIGSNITDLLFSFGIGASIAPVIVDKALVFFDIPLLIFLSCLVMIYFRSEWKLDKLESGSLIGLFILYMIFKITLFQ